ncbi:hypothetical protein [Bathymodiolus septemdierum thioautotrophic gill symbiont]|nr:hypothetical protein [Bathymodiolus septemdierum thioautotrophic gill symbiont]
MRFTVILVSLIFPILSGISFAQEKIISKTNTFYTSNDLQIYKNILHKFEVIGEKHTYDKSYNYSNHQWTIGFLSGIFKKYPKIRKEILNKSTSKFVQGAFLISLYRANIPNEAEKYAASNLSEKWSNYYKTRILSLEEVIPRDTPSENDLLLGAFAATGTKQYIYNMLYYFEKENIEKITDAIKVGLLIEKFGPEMTPKKGYKTKITSAFVKKYNAKNDIKSYLHLMTMGVAIWSIRSNMKKDDNLKKLFEDFLSKNKILKPILKSEINYLSNYIVDFIGYNATKSNILKKSLDRYESLETQINFNKI